MKENFTSNEAHQKVKNSQCVECVRNKGKDCTVFGDKPKKYVLASIGQPCPKRKATNN